MVTSVSCPDSKFDELPTRKPKARTESPCVERCSVSIAYEYNSFGELLRATGPMAKASPFRFSTKYQDDETDLVCYGKRYYNASTGRWLSRDPLVDRAKRSRNKRWLRVTNFFAVVKLA
jgi:RHS repeat-associated protein